MPRHLSEILHIAGISGTPLLAEVGRKIEISAIKGTS
jgi:hypothetical protein